MRMLRWMCAVTKLDNIKMKYENESGGNRKESPGKEVEVVWACDEKRGALLRNNDGNESTREKEERKT